MDGLNLGVFVVSLVVVEDVFGIRTMGRIVCFVAKSSLTVPGISKSSSSSSSFLFSILTEITFGWEAVEAGLVVVRIVGGGLLVFVVMICEVGAENRETGFAVVTGLPLVTEGFVLVNFVIEMGGDGGKVVVVLDIGITVGISSCKHSVTGPFH